MLMKENGSLGYFTYGHYTKFRFANKIARDYLKDVALVSDIKENTRHLWVKTNKKGFMTYSFYWKYKSRPITVWEEV